MKIDRADATDLPRILALLEGSGLPVDGLAAHTDTLMVARDDRDDRLIGCAGLEMYDDAALLRSVAVTGDARGTGVGQRLTRAVLELARSRGIRDVYLLTETAADFFPRFGFVRTTRDQVPDAVKQSVEFTTACPQSAVVMRRTLR
jgi:amino-acid N-acetyltransferase